MKNNYKTICKGVDKVTTDERKEIVELYLQYYNGSDENRVVRDLNNKNVIILMTFENKIVGFTTLEFYERQWRNKNIRVVFSGDTIIKKEHWGQQSLTFACIKRMGEFKQEKPEDPVYWFLIVKGHRTFKYLPVFIKFFYPHWGYQSNTLKTLSEFLALEKFGKDYNPKTGVLEFLSSKGHLKDEIAYPNENEKKKPAVNFFLERNPDYIKGHELVCLCELDMNNMKPLTRRIFNNALS
jgi:hypothetical protein